MSKRKTYHYTPRIGGRMIQDGEIDSCVSLFHC